MNNDIDDKTAANALLSIQDALSPFTAMQAAAVLDRLVEMGWKPPPSADPAHSIAQILCSDGVVRETRQSSMEICNAYIVSLNGRKCSLGCPGGIHDAFRRPDMTTDELIEYLCSITREPMFESLDEWNDWLCFCKNRNPGETPESGEWEWMCPDGIRRLGARPQESFKSMFLRVYPSHHGCLGGGHVLVRVTHPISDALAAVHRFAMRM